MNLKEQRAAALKAARDIVEAAKAEDRDLTPEETEQVEAKTAEVKDIDSKLKSKAVVDSVIGLGSVEDTRELEGTPGGSGKTLGEHFVKAAGNQLLEAKAAGSRFAVSAPEFKAPTDTQTTLGAINSDFLTDRDLNIVQGLRRRLTIADLLASGTLSGNAITYYIEGAMEGDFATVAENATKPQVHFADPTSVTETLKKIAAFIKESDEMVEDLPFMVSAINQRLLYQLGVFEENQILSGDGVGTNLRGLLNRSGIQTMGATTDAAGGNADRLFRAMTAVQTASGLDADGLVINPADYQTLRLSRDANGQYYGGGFFQGPYGNGGVAEQPPVWGLRTVVTPAIAAGTVLVGAFQQAATLYRKGGVRVESTNSDQADFVNNRVTIRAEERIALAVRRPAGLVRVTLGTA